MARSKRKVDSDPVDGVISAYTAFLSALEALKTTDADTLQRGVHRLYWYYDVIPVALIADALDLRSHQLLKLAGPATFKCPHCGSPAEVTSRTSRNALKDKDQAAYICPTCITRRENRQEEHRRLSKDHWAKHQAIHQARIAELRAMPYSAYLQSAHWNARRKTALKMASHRCQVCNSTEQLDVHHRTYIRRGEERADDLLVLCRTCHDLFHKQGKLAK